MELSIYSRIYFQICLLNNVWTNSFGREKGPSGPANQWAPVKISAFIEIYRRNSDGLPKTVTVATEMTCGSLCAQQNVAHMHNYITAAGWHSTGSLSLFLSRACDWDQTADKDLLDSAEIKEVAYMLIWCVWWWLKCLWQKIKKV